jgi:hypothetical protein
MQPYAIRVGNKFVYVDNEEGKRCPIIVENLLSSPEVIYEKASSNTLIGGNFFEEQLKTIAYLYPDGTLRRA